MLATSVQFHAQALQLTEWAVLQPAVERGAPVTKAAYVRLRVRRQASLLHVF